MKDKRIKSIEGNEFTDFWSLYNSSFPIVEKRTFEQQKRILANSSYHLHAFYDGANFIGFLSYWEFETYFYVEHFAINKLLRGRGFGNVLLRKLVRGTEKEIILEIDPIVDEVSRNRLHFYESIAFMKNDFDYKVQSYQEKSELYDLVIMSYPRIITQDELDTFRLDFKNIIL